MWPEQYAILEARDFAIEMVHLTLSMHFDAVRPHQCRPRADLSAAMSASRGSYLA